MKRISALLVLGTFGLLATKPAMADDITDQQMAISMVGANQFSPDTPHIDWVGLMPNVYSNMVEGYFSGPGLPGCIGFKLTTYGENDYEMWLSFAGKDPFYYHSEDPTGTFNADATTPEMMFDMEDSQRQALIAAAGEIWVHPIVTGNPVILEYGSGGYVPPPGSVGPSLKMLGRTLCLLAAVASGGAAKAATETTLMGGRGGSPLGKSTASAFGAVIALGVAAGVSGICNLAGGF